MAMKAASVLFTDVVDGADVGMVQRRRRLGFAPEASQGDRVAGDFIRQKLERHKAVQARVFGFVDHTHTAAAQLLDDAIVRNGLTDQ